MNDEYNVKNYSDKDLYNILDLVNPTDRELEAKLNNMIWKYNNIGGESGEKLSKFFTDIYEHFFEVDEEEEDSAAAVAPAEEAPAAEAPAGTPAGDPSDEEKK